MKKTGFKLFAVSLALCFFFGACNFNINGGRELAEVRVGGGGGRAANPETGLPIFDGSNTTITISDASGRLIAEGPLPLSAEVVVGVEIVVKATVQTASGTWSRTKTHTVKAGINDIDLELSKTPNVVGNFFFDIVETVPLSGVKLRLKFRNGKTFPDTIRMGGNYPKPVTARDSIGRLYLLYHDGSAKKFTRFDVDGNEDTGFQTAVSSELNALPPPIDIKAVAVDGKNNKIFLIIGDKAHCFIENGHNNFVHLDNTLTGISASDTVQSAAAYDGKLFVKFVSGTDEKLFAYDYTISHTALTLYKKPRVPSSSDFKINGTPLDCMGLFADEDGVYCLLSKKNDVQNSDPLYAVGKLICYSHDLDGKVDFDDNPSIDTPFQLPVSHNNSIAFDARYFSYPVGFIGSDEENIYIADDGLDIQYVNENWHIKGNQDRIAAFNRRTGDLIFNAAGATWYEKKPEYPSNTKVLLWEKDPDNPPFMRGYWTSTNGAEASSAANKLFEYSAAEKPTDVFCYDQDGNLYIVWKGSNYNVRRFALKEDGTYEKPGVDTDLTSSTVSAIAVDISNGQNILYFACASGSYGQIQKKSWLLGSLFSSAGAVSGYSVSFNPNSAPVTALAANKDGLFAGIKETYREAGIDKYRLKVKKYRKSDGVAGAELTLVDNAPEYTDPLGNPIDYGSFTDNIRIQYGEAINDLKVFDGVLYGISSKACETQNKDGFPYYTDAFKNSGVLYKIGSTNGTLSGNAVVLAKKDWNDTNKIGYGFYRFIAVKYDEAERIKLIIASDGAWDENGIAAGQQIPKPPAHNYDKVLEYDLAGSLRSERDSGGSFSKTLKLGSGFEWQ